MHPDPTVCIRAKELVGGVVKFVSAYILGLVREDVQVDKNKMCILYIYIYIYIYIYKYIMYHIIDLCDLRLLHDI